ncbi:MAG: TSUP family transporter [Caldithrix sp.]|nr:TSUP family transporter [Caldithrix sp.]
MEYLDLAILFVVGSLAGIINVFAGGGSTLTLPTLIFLGLDSALANGTNRIAIIIQNVFAIFGFQQERVNQFKMSLGYALFTLPGAIIGALAAIRINDLWFQRILAVIMVLVVISMFMPRPGREGNRESSQKPSWMLYLALFGIGFYGGFIQVGVGFLLMAALYHLARYTLLIVNVHKVFIVLIYTIPALLVFILSGNVDFSYGLALGLGTGIGGWFAARLSVKKGEKAIRVVLSLAIIIMSLKLLNIF